MSACGSSTTCPFRGGSTSSGPRELPIRSHVLTCSRARAPAIATKFFPSLSPLAASNWQSNTLHRDGLRLRHASQALTVIPVAACCTSCRISAYGIGHSTFPSQTTGQSSNTFRKPSCAVNLLIGTNPPSEVSVWGSSQPSTCSKRPPFWRVSSPLTEKQGKFLRGLTIS